MLDRAALLKLIKESRPEKIRWARETLLQRYPRGCRRDDSKIPCTGAPVERVFGPDVPMLDEDFNDRRQLLTVQEYKWWNYRNPDVWPNERVWPNEQTYTFAYRKAVQFYQDTARWRRAESLKARQLLWDAHFRGVQPFGMPGKYSPGQDDLVKLHDKTTGRVKYMSLDEAQRARVYDAVMQDRDLKQRIEEWIDSLECTENEPPCLLMPYVNPQLPATQAHDWDMVVVENGATVNVAVCIKFSFICDAPYKGWRAQEREPGEGDPTEEESGQEGETENEGGEGEPHKGIKPSKSGGIRPIRPHGSDGEPEEKPNGKDTEGREGSAESPHYQPWSGDWALRSPLTRHAATLVRAEIGQQDIGVLARTWASHLVASGRHRAENPWDGQAQEY